MTDLLSDVDTPSDAELISRVRGGDVAAYGDLFSRHKDAANRLARQLVRGPDADDLVAEAFAKVLTVLQGGGGPDVAFRAYLLTAVRRLHVDRIRSGARVQTTDDLAPFDAGVPFQDTAVAGFESGAAAKAFASLPERWQLVLWHLEVEGQKPADIAPLLGMSANSVSALAYRAREGLRQAFLTMHLSDTSAVQCRWVNEHLGAYVRKGLAKRDAAKVQSHLDECRRCTAMYLELTEVNSNLAGIIAPLLLGAAAAGYVTATSGGAGTAGVLSLIGRARDVVLANSGAVTAGAVATGVAAAAVATAVVVQVHKNEPDVVADPSQGVTSVLPSSPEASSTDGAPAASPTNSAAPMSSAATPTLSPTPTMSLSPTTTATPPVLPPTALPVVESPGVPAATDTVSPTDTTGATPTGEPAPSTTEPPPPSPPAPTADRPVLSVDGTVTVTVHDVSPSDTVGIRLESASGRTTFATRALTFPASCTPDGTAGTAVECHPGVSTLAGRFAAPAADAVTGDYTVTLPLDYPDDLTDDQVRLVVTINGQQVEDTGFQPFHPTHRFDVALADLSADSHTVSGDTDRYELVATLGSLPASASAVYLALDDGGSFSADQPPGCRLVTDGDHAGQVLCDGVTGGAAVRVAVDSTSHSTHAATLRLLAPSPFTDPTPGNDTATVDGLRPGTDLTLATTADAPVPSADDGDYPVTVHLGDVRPGLSSVFLDPTGGSIVAAPAGCTAVSDTRLRCADPSAGDLPLTVHLDDHAHAASLSITATPGGDFEQLSGGNVAHADLRPWYDFSVENLTLADHTVTADAGGTDHYVLHTEVSDVPSGVEPLTLTLTGGRLSTEQPDCAFLDETHVICRSGAVDLAVESTSTNPQDVAVSLQRPQGYDDPDPADDATSPLKLAPGANLGLTLSVASANPDRNGVVDLTGSLVGIRTGVDRVRYAISGNATFASPSADRNTGCSVSADHKSMSCPVTQAPTQDVALTVLSGDRHHEVAGVTVTATPEAPFVKVGSADNSADLTLPDRPVHDYTLDAMTQTQHTVAEGTDRYTLSGTVGNVGPGFRNVLFQLDGDGAFATEQTDPQCHLVTGAQDGGSVRCDGLPDGGHVDLVVESTSTSTHPVTVTVSPIDPYDDPDDPSDNADSTATVRDLQPGTHLVLGPHTLGALHQAADRTYPVDLQVSGIREGVPAVRFTLDNGVSFAGRTTDGCAVDGSDLVCTGLRNGDHVRFSVTSPAPHMTTSLTVTATPGGDFVDVANGAPDDNTSTGSLTASYDFSMGDLTRTSQTLVGDDTDRYLLHTSVGSRPSGVAPLALTMVDGGRFSSDQPDCSYVDADHVTCPSGAVDLAVESTTTSAHPVTIGLVRPAGYDDPDHRNEQATVAGLRPGVDLRLADLDPDNESPANDDRLHRVATRLDRVRTGLSSVTYDLTGAATFVGISAQGCTVAATTITCAEPAAGPLTFSVRADDVHVATDIRIAATPADPFLELNGKDNSDGVRLLPRPTYDFSMGSLGLEGHTVVGNTDHYTLGSDVGAVPAGVPGLTFTVTGGTFAAGQDTGCTRVDGTHVSCGNLGSPRHIGFRVDSSSTVSHDVEIALQVPSGYDEPDPDPGRDGDDITVEPGVDLHLGLTTSATPRPDGRTYDVTTVLTGVRNGPVTFTVDGATVTKVSPADCAPPTDTHTVTCAHPTVGERITFTLRPSTPTVPTSVTIAAAPGASAGTTLQEVDGRDNAVKVTLSPDVVLSSVVLRADASDFAVVRGQVSGVPAGVGTVRVHLTGDEVGTGGGSVHFTGGPVGADGQGSIDCYTSDASGHAAPNGVWATCTGVTGDDDGSFYIDMRLAHPDGTARTVTFTVVPVGVDEGAFADNNSRDLTLD